MAKERGRFCGPGEEVCRPEHAQANEQMMLALSQVTTWNLPGDVVTLNGGTPLRFRAASH